MRSLVAIGLAVPGITAAADQMLRQGSTSIRFAAAAVPTPTLPGRRATA